MNIHSPVSPSNTTNPSDTNPGDTDRTQSRRAVGDKRLAILDAALELFVEYGFHGTAVPQIAKQAKVGAGTIYRYFTNKEALVNVLFRRWKTTLSEEVLEAFPFDAPAREQFRAYWTRMTDFARKHPRAQAFLELHHHAAYLDDESRALEERLLQTALAVVQRMQAMQAVRPVRAEILIAVMYGAMLGLLKAAWHGHLDLDDATVAVAEQCCWEAIRA